MIKIECNRKLFFLNESGSLGEWPIAPALDTPLGAYMFRAFASSTYCMVKVY